MEAAAPTKTIDIVIPAFNEEGNIARAVQGETIGTLIRTDDHRARTA